MIIQNFGLFWRRENVFWNYDNRDTSLAAELLGREKNAKVADPNVDFKDQIGIYVLYQGFDLVYVGIAGESEKGSRRLLTRLKEHTNDDMSERWDRFSWFGLKATIRNGKLGADLKRVTTTYKDILKHVEAILISTTESPLNKQGGQWHKAKKYLQVRDERLPKTLEAMLLEIYDEVKT